MSDDLKTITIGNEDQPLFSLCPGHVDSDTFNTAFVAEGWSNGGEFDLAHEYWTQEGDYYKISEKSDPNAAPYTVSRW